MTDADQDIFSAIEATLNVNMAACALKLKEFKKALDYWKMVSSIIMQALNIDKLHIKAIYRKSQALLGIL